MQISDEMRIAARQAFKRCRPVDRVACQDFGMQQDDIIDQQLDAAITAALAGHVVVPREPTAEPLTAAGDAFQDYAWKMTDVGGAIDAADYALRALRAVIYRAMIDVGTKDAQS